MAKLEVEDLEVKGDFVSAELSFTDQNLYRVVNGEKIALSEGKANELFALPTTVTGQQQYTTQGAYSWVCPAGVYQVSVVCIGGGGAGQDNWANPAGGGAGLGWKNEIPVTPGVSYTVNVGDGGSSTSSSGAASMKGGNSYFNTITTVAGMGGGNISGPNCYSDGPNQNGNSGGGYVGDGGGSGGNAPNYQGGGGAGGYGGRGGNGQESEFPGWNNDSGGAGGGSYYSSTYGTGAGGGTGLNGEGALNGNQPFYNPFSGYNNSVSQGSGGSGRAGGTNGMYGQNPFSGSGQSSSNVKGGDYGGGGGGPGTSWPSASGNGGLGGVRIIWGPPGSRSYPSNAT